MDLPLDQNNLFEILRFSRRIIIGEVIGIASISQNMVESLTEAGYETRKILILHIINLVNNNPKICPVNHRFSIDDNYVKSKITYLYKIF